MMKRLVTVLLFLWAAVSAVAAPVPGRAEDAKPPLLASASSATVQPAHEAPPLPATAPTTTILPGRGTTPGLASAPSGTTQPDVKTVPTPVTTPTATTKPAQETKPGLVTAPTATKNPAAETASKPVATPSAAATPGMILPGARLTVDQCVAIALQRSPALQAASGAVNVGKSRVGQARSAWYPQLTVSGGYAKYSAVADPTNAVQDQYTANASVTQNLFDFGRTWNSVAVQQKNATAAREDLRNTNATIILNVKQAYYGLLQAEKNRDVLQETVKSFQQHLEQAKGFFEAGVKSKFDVTKAEVDLSNARLNLIRAENALRIARVTLNNAMGAPDAPDYTIEDTLAFRKTTISFADARERAFANRPDLRFQAARREAAESSLSLARSNYYPTLTGSASYIRSEENFPPEPAGWSAGVTLTIPLFSGFLTNNQVREAKENLVIARANEETLRQNALLDVQQSFLKLQEAEERVGVAELTVQQAQENYDIAKGRYDAGVGSPIEETDALVALSNAKTNYIAALADYKVAEAALSKAMGE